LRALRAALLVLLVALIAVQFSGARSAACGPGPGYYVTSYNGDIDPGSADFLSSAVSSAQASCAGNFVLVLTTNGGDGGSMEQMVQSITSYQGWGGNFTTLIAPSGAFAYSAGAYVSEASTHIYMAAGTVIGSATPIVSGIPTGEVNSTMTKDIDAFSTYMRTLAQSNGRNATAAGLMVLKGVSYTNSEAVRNHAVDGMVNSSSLAGALAELGVPAGTPVQSEGVRSVFISVLSDPNVSSLLFLIGVFAVLADIYHPTIILSVVGVALVALALLGLGVFGASAVSVGLMILGAAFIFLEVKTQHGVSAALGVAVFVVGFLLVYQSPGITGPSTSGLPEVAFSGPSDLTYALLAAVGAAVVIGSVYLRRVRDAMNNRPSQFDPGSKVGKRGWMETDLVPDGRGVANVASEQWTATSAQPLKKGDSIVVKGVKGNELVVEKSEN
jgi:membrane-bound serine protease (ClpP class)